MSLTAPDHLAEAPEAEDEHERRESERAREHPGRDLLADGERGDCGGAGIVGEDRHEQGLLHAGAARSEGEQRGDHLDGEHEQGVRHRATDVERIE